MISLLDSKFKNYGIDLSDKKAFFKLFISCIINKDISFLNTILTSLKMPVLEIDSSKVQSIRYNNKETADLESFSGPWKKFLLKNYTAKEKKLISKYVSDNIHLLPPSNQCLCNILHFNMVSKCKLNCIFNINGYCNQNDDDGILENILNKSAGETDYIVKKAYSKLVEALINTHFVQNERIILYDDGCALCGGEVQNSNDFCSKCIKNKSLIGCIIEKRYRVPIKMLFERLVNDFSITDLLKLFNLSKQNYYDILSALKIPYPENEIQSYLELNTNPIKNHLIILNYVDFDKVNHDVKNSFKEFTNKYFIHLYS